MFRRIFPGAVILMALLITQTVPHAAAAECDSAQFVSDITVPDGAAFVPGAAFTKTWRLMNNGSCTWSTAYNLVWVGGDALGAPLTVKLPVAVPPRQMLDLSVGLTAPMASGHYKGLWKISDASGAPFGIGALASDPFWVDINVVEASAVIYDFTANAPYAVWKSEKGILPYPGTSGDSRGYSYQVNNPHLEDDSFDPSPGLLAVPQNKYNGYIQAVYPEIQIQQGDRLQTLINCEFGARGCFVTFRIDYLTSAGNQRTLWSGREAYEGRFYRANIDLSSLAGQRVKLILMVHSTGSAGGDRAVWGSPRIVRSGTTQPPAPPATFPALPPLTPTGTAFAQPAPSLTPPGCNKASFVADITVPDGSLFSPGAAFTKTWRLKNMGSCGWTTAYQFLFYGGEQMSAPTSISLPKNIAVGESVDLAVNMAAPGSAGKYRGFWILSNPSGALFGIGTNASMPIWVEINVAGDTPDEMDYNFWGNACAAQWRSSAGSLPCPGVEGDPRGFITSLKYTRLEDGTMGPAPSLLMSPENRYNGYIQGIYPAFTVKPGDLFYSGVGCEYGYSCYVTFQLDYMTATGSIRNFWTRREQNEGLTHSINLDLSPLAGQSVRFILTILATGSASGDRVRWTAPHILRAPGAAVTVTPPTATNTASVTPTPTSVFNDWLSYSNSRYGFELKIPPQALISGQQDNYARFDLPFMAGTNLIEKYLEVVVAENADPCQSPLPSRSFETVTINGISFLKQTDAEGGMSHLHQWITYSTARDNACVSLDFMLYSVDPGVFYPDMPPVFDFPGESAVFEGILSTFAWLAPTPTPSPTATATPPAASLAEVQSVEIQIVESQPLQANAIVRGQLPDSGCTLISSVSQVRDGNTFRLALTTGTDPLAACDPTPTAFEKTIPLEAAGLPPARYTVNANGVEQSFELITRDLAKFGQALVDELNAGDFGSAKVMMDEAFIMAFWQSQGTSYPPDAAIEQLGNYIGTGTQLIPDPGRDLNAALGGLDPYALMGLDAATSQALFVSGWGLDGKGEAILYATRLPDGSLYWYGVLIAPAGFATP